MPRAPRRSPSPGKEKDPNQRLPVNPRRKKVSPDDRKRVATACNSCNTRRVKCSGDQPCTQCGAANRPCIYPPPIEKVSIDKNELDRMRNEIAALRKKFTSASSGASSVVDKGAATASGEYEEGAESDDDVDNLDNVDNYDNTVEMMDIDDSKGGRMLSDRAGVFRYHGTSSGPTFLDRLKEFMINSGLIFGDREVDPFIKEFIKSCGHYQTNDSRVLRLPKPRAVPSWSPSAVEPGTTLLPKLRGFLMEGESGGIFFWPLFPDSDQNASQIMAQGGPRAGMYYAALALATMLGPTEPNSMSDGSPQAQAENNPFYARAHRLAGKPLNITRYEPEAIALLTLMAMVEIENNRRDWAYIYVGHAMRLCTMHGVHEGEVQRVDRTHDASRANEMERRIFWTLYILDRWLNCLMGRPPTIAQEALRLEKPRYFHDLPEPAGLIAHIELSEVSDFIVSTRYKLAVPLTQEVLKRYIADAHYQLKFWETNLPPVLRMTEERKEWLELLRYEPTLMDINNTVTSSGAQDRAFCMLHMACNQLFILTVRPAFLTAIRRSVGYRVKREQRPDLSGEEEAQLRECGERARQNLMMAAYLRTISPAHKLLIQDYHNIFNAAIIIMMHQIVFLNERTTDKTCVDFAIGVFGQEPPTGNAYLVDCTKVLEALKRLVPMLRKEVFNESVESPLPTENLAADSAAPVAGPAAEEPLRSSRGRLLVSRYPTLAAVSADETEEERGQIMEEMMSWIKEDDLTWYRKGACMVDV